MPRTTQTRNTDLVITRTFNAPRELVFACWVDLKHLARWGGAPEGFTVTTVEMDIRPGGRFKHCMHSPSGDDYWLQGAYREVTPPEKLVFTHAWLDGNGNPGPETVVTLTFRELGKETELKLHQTGFTSTGARDGHAEGWNSTLDRLAEYLTRPNT